MHTIDLDASTWRSKADFYRDLLPALGAPDWHGDNLDALADSLRGGDINEHNPPLQIRVNGLGDADPGLQAALAGFQQLAGELTSDGIPVVFQVSQRAAT